MRGCLLDVDLVALHAHDRLADGDDLVVPLAGQTDLQPPQPLQRHQERVQQQLLDPHLARTVQHRHAVHLDVVERTVAQTLGQRAERARGIVEVQNPVAQFQGGEFAVI